MKKVGVVIRIKTKSPFRGTYKETIDLRKDTTLSYRQKINEFQQKASDIRKHHLNKIRSSATRDARKINSGVGYDKWTEALVKIPKKKIEEAIAAYDRVYVENLSVIKIKGVSAIAARQNEQYINIYAAYFQRLVSRTPIDEDYYYRTKSGRLRLHKADNDVTREDWVMIVNGNIVITSKEFGFSAFLNFNDKNTIKRIANKIESQLKNKAVLHTVSVENKNWKFPILEDGKYPSSSNENNVVATANIVPVYPHGTKNGYSLQAPHGIEKVTKAEMSMVFKTSKQGYRSYMGRALKKEVDIKALKPYVKKIYNQKEFREIDEKLFMKTIYEMEKQGGDYNNVEWAFRQLEKKNIEVNGDTFNDDTYLAKTTDRLDEKLRKNRVRKKNYRAKKYGYASSRKEREDEYKLNKHNLKVRQKRAKSLTSKRKS